MLTGSSDRSIHLSRAVPKNAENSSTAIESDSPIKKYEAHGYSVVDIAVAADNARFASVGGDRPVFLWDVEQGITTRRFSGHTSKVEAVQFAGEGDSVVVSGNTPHLSSPILKTFSLLTFLCLEFRECRYDCEPMGYSYKRPEAYPIAYRSYRHSLMPPCPYALILYRER